jgi:hypothetical protein
MKLQTVLVASLFIVCCVSLGLWTSTRALAKENSSGANVWMVDKVEIAILKSNPPKLSITATGRVQTAGWTNPKLSQVMYVMPPPDGIQGFMFSATAPKGTPAQVISPISATAIMDDLSSWVRGVRVHGASNTKEALLSKSTDGGNSGSKCEKRGTLETEIVAIGGETTGIVIHTKDGDWDLDFRDNKELDKLADTLNKKAVIVSGICRKIEGVEKPERNIIEVTHLAPADAH